MDRKGGLRRALLLFLLLLFAFALAGCRQRITGSVPPTDASAPAAAQAGNAEAFGEALSGAAVLPSESADADAAPQTEEAGGRAKENPEASRKEFDENAPAEAVPGTDRLLHGEGEGNGAAAPAREDAADAVSRLNSRAEDTATQTVPAEEAEDMGAAEDAEEAESALTYFTVLLQDRMGSLYECQRANVYWETAQDHVTVHKSSPEHALILNAGAYDVSARLLPENLRVDDGWVARKNPQVIVKIVDGGVLGRGVPSAVAAKEIYRALCARDGWQGVDAVRSRRVLLLSQELLEAPYLQTAAMLLIAGTAHPDLFSDVDMDQALRMLSEEAAGTLPTGTYYYSGKEE